MRAPLVDAALSLAALPPLAAGAYLAALAGLARRSAPPAPAGVVPRFAVVVPAHDEERGIAATVHSLLALDYPREALRILVVADNCSDATAAAAEAAGAEVLVRVQPARPGKGHALRFAFDQLLREGAVDAVAVVDADTLVSGNLLAAFAARLARGGHALQAHYAVRNAEESWRTRLLALAFAAMHGVRSLARERLSLSCGLRGNGMAFSAELLRRVPHAAWSVVEDVEYGLQLGCAGERVQYVAEAEVRGEMAADERASRAQRRRWELGRREIARRHALPLLRRAAAARSAVLADLAADLLVPPLATLVTWSLAGLAACAAAAALGWSPHVAPWLFAAALAAVAGHVARAWALSGAGARGLLDLALAPAYVAWKLWLRLGQSRRAPGEWVRTRRAGEE